MKPPAAGCMYVLSVSINDRAARKPSAESTRRVLEAWHLVSTRLETVERDVTHLLRRSRSMRKKEQVRDCEGRREVGGESALHRGPL